MMDKYAVIVSKFNEPITQSLLEGALESFQEHQIPKELITVSKVPGAFEIPLIAKAYAQNEQYRAVVCLGAIIRGETAHFEYVAGPVASQLSQLSVQYDVPIIFGILTTENAEQAFDRAGGKKGNKGYDAAEAAIEMSQLTEELYNHILSD